MASTKISKKAKPAVTKNKAVKAPVKKNVVKKAILRKSIILKAVSKTKRPAPGKTVAKKKRITARKPLSPVELTTRPKSKVITRTKEPIFREQEIAGSLTAETPVMEITSPEKNKEALNIPLTNDPIMGVDQKAFDKFTVKGDPQQHLQLSSRRKSTIKPSGKKPLWN